MLQSVAVLYVHAGELSHTLGRFLSVRADRRCGRGDDLLFVDVGDEDAEVEQ